EKPTTNSRRGRVPTHSVKEKRVKAVGELVRVAAGLTPRVCPVRSGKDEQSRGRVVEIRAKLAEVPALPEEASDPFFVAAAFGDDLVPALPFEIAPLLHEDGRDVELVGDDPEVGA